MYEKLPSLNARKIAILVSKKTLGSGLTCRVGVELGHRWENTFVTVIEFLYRITQSTTYKFKLYSQMPVIRNRLKLGLWDHFWAKRRFTKNVYEFRDEVRNSSQGSHEKTLQKCVRQSLSVVLYIKL